MMLRVLPHNLHSSWLLCVCAVQTYCWGDAGAELGNGDPDKQVPYNSNISEMKAVDFGPGRYAISLDGRESVTCAVLNDGLGLVCWGDCRSSRTPMCALPVYPSIMIQDSWAPKYLLGFCTAGQQLGEYGCDDIDDEKDIHVVAPFEFPLRNIFGGGHWH